MKRFLAVFGFGFIGSALRLGMTQILPSHHYFTLILINITGSFLLAIITNALPIVMPIPGELLTGLTVGLVGSFTTFSTFCLDSVQLGQTNPFWSLCYCLLSISLGLSAAYLGVKQSHRLIRRHQQ